MNSAVVIFIDGLGYENLKNGSAYARFLLSNKVDSIRCEFPSTTATSITGFATGERSGSHGIIGYSAYDRATNEPLNLLSGWSNPADAQSRKILKPFSEALKTSQMSVVGPAAYQESGFTELTMSAANYLAEDNLGQRFSKALQQIRVTNASQVIYLYIPELDQIAHRSGVDSSSWLEALEDVDQMISKFCDSLPSGTGVLVVSDHGVLDVPASNQIYLDEFEWYANFVKYTSGDPRCNFVYLNSEFDLQGFLTSASSEFGSECYVAQPFDLVERGWMTEFTEPASKLLPDVYLIWNSNRVAYDRRTAQPRYLKMIGQHGGISDREMRIPLIRLGAY